MKVSRKMLAVVFGTVVAVVLIIAIEALSHTIYPVPDGLDLTNPEILQAYVMGMPIAALLIVLGAWLVANTGRRIAGLLYCKGIAAGLFSHHRRTGSPRNDYQSHLYSASDLVFNYRHSGHHCNDFCN